MKLTFESDYNNGAHPAVLRRLLETNDEKSETYGFDEWSLSAKEKIKKACEDKDAQVTFLVGGTQTNSTVLATMLQPYEGVVSVDTGHIAVHEAGAVERTGHKVLALPGYDGKLDATELDAYLKVREADPDADHCVWPGIVYITFPTEYGTLYTASELSAIHSVCQRHGLPLYVDGARLGYGIVAPGNDISLPFLAHHCDAFYIGGTKVGALCGEAVVFTHANEPRHFFTMVKQHGALLAKGRLTGIQFDTLFTDNLYFRIARHAIDMAQRLKQLLADCGFEFYLDSPTNQQFVIIPNDRIGRLAEQVEFSRWAPYDEKSTVCRFVTSWATTEEEMQQLEKILDNYK